MKKNKKVVLCGMLSALSLVIMLGSYIPFMTYSIPALASIVFCIIVIAVDKKYAFASYICSAVLSFFLCEKEAAMLFIMFFGFYPILKSVYEQINKRWVEWFLKIATFTVSITVAYIIINCVLQFDVLGELNGTLGNLLIPVVYIVANVIFLCYDYLLTLLIMRYGNTVERLIVKFINR